MNSWHCRGIRPCLALRGLRCTRGVAGDLLILEPLADRRRLTKSAIGLSADPSSEILLELMLGVEYPLEAKVIRKRHMFYNTLMVRNGSKTDLEETEPFARKVGLKSIS